MSYKRQVYCSHKGYFHLNRKKAERLESLFRQLEIELIGHGNYPVDMPRDKDIELANAIQK